MTLISPGDFDISEERLASLISLKSEYDDLDYKEEWDISGIHKMKAIKTIAAMSSNKNGGYIVIGVRDDGEVIGLSDDSLTDKPFDPSKLNQIYRCYTGNSGIISRVHKIYNKNIVLIYVPRSPDHFSVMTKEGKESQGSNKIIFREGDVFVRKGSSSIKWNKTDASEIIENIRSIERQKVLDSYSEAFKYPCVNRRVTLDSNFLSMSLDKQFQIIELSSDIESLTQQSKSLAEKLFLQDQSIIELDKNRQSFLSFVSHLMLKDENNFTKVISNLQIKYANNFSKSNLSVDESRIALNIGIIIESLGALAVRYEKFNLVYEMSSFHIETEGCYKYSSWLRHAQVMASRNKITARGIKQKDSTATFDPSPLITGAIEESKDVIGLRPEYRTELEYEANKDTILNSIATFDFLWCLIAFHEGNSRDFLPGFILFSEERIIDMVSILFKNENYRSSILKTPSVEVFTKACLNLIAETEKIRDSFSGSIIFPPDNFKKINRLLAE